MSLTTMTELAYDEWEPGLNDQLEHEEGSLYSFLKKSSKRVSGRNTFIKIKTGRSTGITQVDEGGDFPAAGDPTYDEAQIALKRTAATVEFTLDEMDLLNGSEAAAIPVVQEKLDDLLNTVRRDIMRQTYGDGTAALARCEAGGPSADVILQADNGDAGSANDVDRDRFLWLEPNGMKVAIVDGVTGAVNTSGLSISDIDESTNTITLSASVTTVDTEIIVRSGNTTASGGAIVSREFPGVRAMVADDNTYETLDRTAAGFGFWKAIVVPGDTAGTNQPITPDRVLKLINRVTIKNGKSPVNSGYRFFANLGVWSAYGEYLQTGVRYDAMKTLDFGWPTLTIFGLPFHADIHCPKHKLYLLKTDEIEYRRPRYDKRGLFQFRNEDGSVWRYKGASSGAGYSTAVQSHLTGMMTLVSERPNRHGVLDDNEEVGV